MEKFIELLKIFLEKHLIPSVIAIIVGILSIAYTPEEAKLIVRIGKPLYAILFFCFAFIIIEFILWIVKTIREKIDKNRENTRKKEYQESEMKEILENVWTLVDRMMPQDREMLMEFLKNNNSPICVKGELSSNCLLTSSYVVSTVVPNDEKVTLNDPSGILDKKEGKIFIPKMSFGIQKRHYILRDDFYKILKYSYEKYGRISHFATEEENNG